MDCHTLYQLVFGCIRLSCVITDYHVLSPHTDNGDDNVNRPTRLSANFVKTVNTPGRYGDGRGGLGLSLLVKESNAGSPSKSWSQRLRIDGQEFNVGLGRYPVVGLGRARDKALENARTVETGGDPRRQESTILTFADCWEQSIEVKRASWRNAKTEKNQRAVMSEHVLPVIGRKPVDGITPADVLAFLAPLALEKPAIAKKAKQGLSQTFKWAIAQGLRNDNPSDANIGAALPKLTTREHHRALPFAEVGAAVRTVRDSDAWAGTKAAFEFLVLTATRSNEVRFAEWSEINLDSAVWTVPAEKMKTERDHRVPLSGAALAVLEGARDLSGGVGLLFPSIRGRALSDSTMSKLLRENGIAAVPHGFRSSFRNWAAESGIDRQTAESALAHAVGDATEAAYLTSDMLAMRRAAMEAWATYLTR